MHCLKAVLRSFVMANCKKVLKTLKCNLIALFLLILYPHYKKWKIICQNCKKLDVDLTSYFWEDFHVYSISDSHNLPIQSFATIVSYNMTPSCHLLYSSVHSMPAPCIIFFPPGCFGMNVVRSYTSPSTADHISSLVWCFATSLTAIVGKLSR